EDGSGTAFSDGTLLRSEFHGPRVGVRELRWPQVRELDRGVALGGVGGMVRYPGEDRLPVLDGGGLVRRGNYVEPRRHTAVRPTLGFARVMGREDEEVSRPGPPHALEAVPQPGGPGVALAAQVGAAHRAYEQEVTGERQRRVGHQREAAQGVPGDVRGDERGPAERDGVTVAQRLVREAALGAVVGGPGVV